MAEGDQAPREGGGAPSEKASRAAARWSAAERQLYPLIVSDPDLYERAVQLVVEARDVLRSECSTLTALVEAAGPAVLERCPSASSVREQGLDPVIAFQAACAERMRELSVAAGGQPE